MKNPKSNLPKKGQNALLPLFFDTKPVPTLVCTPDRRGITMSFECPWCPTDRHGKPVRHWHGLSAGITHRVSHCKSPWAPAAGYFVTLETIQP